MFLLKIFKLYAVILWSSNNLLIIDSCVAFLASSYDVYRVAVTLDVARCLVASLASSDDVHRLAVTLDVACNVFRLIDGRGGDSSAEQWVVGRSDLSLLCLHRSISFDLLLA